MTAKTLTETEMFKLILDEVRLLRQRMDDHIDAEAVAMTEIQRDISKICIEMAGHKVKLSGITAGIALAVSCVTAWVMNQIGR